MSELRVMGRPGDTKMTWDRTNAHEVENAERTFDDLTDQGFTAFAVTAGGERGERIREFDKNAQSIIMVPRMQGG